MKLVRLSRILLFSLLLLSMFGCTQKSEHIPVMGSPKPKAWLWDDQKSNWFVNGSAFNPDDLDENVWQAQKKAISINIQSVQNLKAFDNAPNALLMKVFQLTDTVAFLQAAQSSTGLRHLLTTEVIDPACLTVERFIVLPGTRQSLQLDRAEGVRYVGIVLGYSNLKQAQIFRLIPIVALDNLQLVADASSVMPKNATTNSVKSSLNYLRPAELEIDLSLSADGINKLNVQAK